MGRLGQLPDFADTEKSARVDADQAKYGLGQQQMCARWLPDSREKEQQRQTAEVQVQEY